MIGDIVANSIVEKMSRIDHYQGEIKIFGEENSTIRLYYRKLWNIHQEIIEPSIFRGELFIYDGNRFIFYSPVKRIAFLITGIQGLTDEEWRIFIRQRMERSKKTSIFKKEGEGSILGRKATIYRSSPKVDNLPLPLVNRTWIDDSLRIPLKSINYRSDGSILRGFEHTRIDFETPLPHEAFNPDFALDTRIIRWDFKREESERHSGKGSFRLDCLQEGLSLKRRVVSHDASEMLLSLYENRPYFLIVGQWPEGSVTLPFSGGCRLDIHGREYRLLYYSGLHLVDFRCKGRHVFLFSNLTLNDLLGMSLEAEGMGLSPLRAFPLSS